MPTLPEEAKSLWRDFYPGRIYPELERDLSVDVAVVGAGITGLTSAYLLKQAGLKVAVLDKDTVGGGTSGRTTGKVTSQHNLHYHDLQKRLGKTHARMYAEANQSAVEQVEAIIKRERIDCDWARDDNYVYTADPSQIQAIKQEAQTAASLGLPATFETATPLPFDVLAAVKFASQGKMNTQKYVLGLAGAVDGGGSYVFEHSKVIGIREGRPGRVRTSKGTVRASHIIVATNVPTLPLVARGAYCFKEYPTESYIVAGRLERDLPGMYISPDKEHYSILPLTVGQQRMLLIGGEGHLSGGKWNHHTRYQRLADYAQKHFGVSEILNRWSDRDYLVYDNIPLVGRLYPWSKELYVATGFLKWGLSNGTVSGMILSDLIQGKPNPWAETFDSNRMKPVASIPRAVMKHISG